MSLFEEWHELRDLLLDVIWILDEVLVSQGQESWMAFGSEHGLSIAMPDSKRRPEPVRALYVAADDDIPWIPHHVQDPKIRIHVEDSRRDERIPGQLR